MIEGKNRITPEGIETEFLTENEFKLLPYLDSKIYIESAFARFTGWHSSYDNMHPDWKDRVRVQRQLSNCFVEACKLKKFSKKDDKETKVLFLGASLGSIATLFFYSEWKEMFGSRGLEIHIVDLIEEPLVRTKSGDFELPNAALKDCDLNGNVTEEDYKNILKECHIHESNVISLPKDLSDFDIVIAPYIHHHLNIYDKKKACEEIYRVTKQGGIILIGDLYFEYNDFNLWLKRHKAEDFPYAIESFINKEMHRQYLGNTDLITELQNDFSYAFCVKKI